MVTSQLSHKYVNILALHVALSQHLLPIGNE